MSTEDFQKKFSAVMETLIQTAIAETTDIFETVVGELQAEFLRIKTENQHLRLECSQRERAARVYSFNSHDHQKVLAKSDDDFKKRHTEVQSEISLDVTVEDTQMEVEPTIWLQHSLNTQPDAVICDDDICQDRLTNRRQNERSILHPDDVHLRSGQSPGLAIESQPFTRDGWAQTDSSKIIKQSVKATIGQNTSLKENLPAVVKLEKIPVPVSSGSVLVSRPLKGASLYCWSFSKPGPTKEVASTPNHNFDQDISSPNGFQEETQSTTFEDTGECLPPTSNDQFSAQKAASAVAQGPEKVSHETLHSKAFCAETRKSEKRNPKAVLASLQSHVQRHVQARRTKTSPQTVSCDQSNNQRSLFNSEGAPEPTAIAPTTLSCQTKGSSPPTSRRPGKPKQSPPLKGVKSRITQKSGRKKNTTADGVCSKNAGACISLKGSKVTHDASEENGKVVTRKARKIAQGKNDNELTMQTKVKKGAQLSKCKKTKVQNPHNVLPVSGTPDANSAPPVASPTDPLSFIGSRLLKNQCGICGQILTGTAALENHVSLHTNDRPFSCSLCGKTFKDSASFKRHNRVHRNGRIHVCQQCGKGFVYGFSLTKHVNMVHKHIRPFVCPTCNKGCYSKLILEEHMRMHTGEKPFHCHLCDKKFIRRVNLNVHLRRHNGEKRHWCPVCGKGFLEPNHLKQHKYIHTGEKPHSCPQCSKSFTQSAHLKTHLKNVHKAK